MQNFRKSVKLLFFLLLIAIGTQAQNDSIMFEAGLSRYNYYYNGEQINGNRVLEIIENNTESYEQFKSANEAYVFANVFAFTGILFIVTPVGMKFAGYEPNWSMSWAGAGILIVSIPLFHKYNKNIPVALDQYNQSFSGNKTQSSIKLDFGATNNGIGLSLRF